jgi:hypothetical protein
MIWIVGFAAFLFGLAVGFQVGYGEEMQANDAEARRERVMKYREARLLGSARNVR